MTKSNTSRCESLLSKRLDLFFESGANMEDLLARELTSNGKLSYTCHPDDFAISDSELRALNHYYR